MIKNWQLKEAKLEKPNEYKTKFKQTCLKLTII